MKQFALLTLAALIAFGAPARAGETVSLEALLQAARQNNAELIAARERWNASRERVVQAKTWQDPKLVAEFWSIPEGTFDVGAAMEKMYGIEQMIPFPGKLSVRGRMASADADAARWAYRAVELDVLARLKSVYATYYSVTKSIAVYRETATLMEAFAKTAEARYVAGRSSQNDVLRAQVEAEKMRNMLITLGQEQETARVELNLLTGKPADEPLGEPAELPAAAVAGDWDEVRALAAAGNPELGRMAAGVEKARAARAMAKQEYLPDFDIGYRRKTIDGAWAGSDLMVGVSVPLWFWKQQAGVIEMSADLKAMEAGRRNAELMAVSRAKEAWTKLDSACRLIELYERSVVPRAEQSLKVTQSAFTAGRMSFLELLDSVRAYLEFKLEYYTAVADYQKNLAALESIVGTELR